MTIYTVVDEGYYVEVFHTRIKLFDILKRSDNGYYLDQDCGVIATPKLLAKELKANNIVRLWEVGHVDWTYRIEKHV